MWKLSFDVLAKTCHPARGVWRNGMRPLARKPQPWEGRAREDRTRWGLLRWSAGAWQRLRRVVATMVMLSAWPLGSADTPAAESADATAAYQAKAEFLLNFARFVSWPEKSFAGPDAHFVIGVLGDNPFGHHLAETVRGEIVKGRKLEVRCFPSIMQNFESAQILFVSRSEKNKLRTIFGQLRDSAVLTVGDTDGFAQRGGMINFVVVQTNVHFEINTRATERVGLTISSKLLDLPKAIKVHTGREGQMP